MTEPDRLSVAIRRYVQHFECELHKISELENEDWQKTLLFALLEALARGHFGRGKRPSDRFCSLLRGHSGWADAERVSVPQLKEQILAGASGISKSLRSWIVQQPGDGDDISSDPPERDLQRLCETKEDKRFVMLHRHDRLLYQYRSTFVHEARQAGYGMECKDDYEPFYSMTKYQCHQTSEIVYPVGFLCRLAEETLGSLEAFYAKERIDPYSRYLFGSLIYPVFKPQQT